MINIEQFRKIIIYEDNHLLVVDKPSGIAVQGRIDNSLYLAAKKYLKNEYNKPGDAWLGIVHRLDQATSGVVVLAKTSKAASRLSEQFRGKTIGKFYLCIVEGKLKKNSVTIENFLKKVNRFAVISKIKKNGYKKAILTYRLLSLYKNLSLCSVRLISGHYHQIRSQLGNEGRPVLGDLKYGGKKMIGKGRIALLCRKMIISHPVTGKRFVFKSRQEIRELIKK